MSYNEKTALAKQKSIKGILSEIGFQPVKQSGNELIYHSPFSNDSNASFFLNEARNVFNDFSTGQKGDSITFLQLLEGSSFNESVQKLLNRDQSLSFSFSGSESLNPPKLQIKAVKELSNPSLIQYLESRSIDPEIGRKWLREIHFTNNNKRYFALGFKNDSGGYELRNGVGFKAKTKNGITTIQKGTKSASVFEGFFDFLSALQYYHITEPNNTTYVLNTVANHKLIYPEKTTVNKLFCFLDNDQSGKNTLKKLSEAGFEVIDMAPTIYPNHKDFNEFLVCKA